MNSITFTALARWADDQGCEIGMHEMPGAMQYADGALVLLYSEDRDLYVFVRSDGTVSKPRTRASMLFCLALKHDMEEAAKCNR